MRSSQDGDSIHDECVKAYHEIEAKNANLRDAIRGEQEKNGILSIWLKEEGDEKAKLNLQNGELKALLWRAYDAVTDHDLGKDLCGEITSAVGQEDRCRHCGVLASMSARPHACAEKRKGPLTMGGGRLCGEPCRSTLPCELHG